MSSIIFERSKYNDRTSSNSELKENESLFAGVNLSSLKIGLFYSSEIKTLNIKGLQRSRVKKF